MEYKQWTEQVPPEIKKDAVWSLKVYRAALFVSDLCWHDVNLIINQKLFSLSDQLYRSVGSISANIAEGYSRQSHKEQARYYEIALGSTREAKDWYFKSRHILEEETAFHRIKLLTSIAKLLLVMINERRSTHAVRDREIKYNIEVIDKLLSEAPLSEAD